MKVGKLIALALIAHLLAAPVAAEMFVLCVGSDGHVAVESAGESLCCRQWESAHRGTGNNLMAAIEPASDPCCNDVNLSVDSATLTVPTKKAEPAPALPCCGSVLAAPLQTAFAETLPLLTESSIAASLRTIVIRA